MNLIEYTPWICWISPLIGALLTFFSKNNTVKGMVSTFSVFISWSSALYMLSLLSNKKVLDIKSDWFSLPVGSPVSLGMLIDPLSITMMNIVSFVSFLILVYSIWYMRKEYGQARYWPLMSLFTSSMLLLVLADNLILFFIAWKMVGLCSYALIGHYYRDEERYWIGGPPPNSYQKPSTCALKALLVTSFGDVAMLAGIIIIYLYSGTFSFTTLLDTSSNWMGKMSETPGLILGSTLLLLAGVVGKSAQFPLHIWLPEAMAGPAPVSALIHAATMVKAGVYIVARLFPIYYGAYWINGFHEAGYFFQIIAFLGVVTAFITATEAVVALELKKVLAYSTMSQIGYMMLGLGVAGLSTSSIVNGYTGSIFHLLNHALFKAALFMSAGAIIHLTGSIYIHEKSLDRRSARYIWLFTWIAVLSLIGIPPFSGFWSKDEILLACLESGQYLLFSLALLTVMVTVLYSVRMMYHLFYINVNNYGGGEVVHVREEPAMIIPMGILSTLSLGVGVIGYWFNDFFKEIFQEHLSTILRFELHPHIMSMEEILTPICSISIMTLAVIASYLYYVRYRVDFTVLVTKYSVARTLHKLFWNRWYIDKFYELVFVNSFLSMRENVQDKVEAFMDSLLNICVPKIFSRTYHGLRSIQTGLLSINMLYVMVFLTFMVIFMLLVM